MAQYRYYNISIPYLSDTQCPLEPEMTDTFLVNVGLAVLTFSCLGLFLKKCCRRTARHVPAEINQTSDIPSLDQPLNSPIEPDIYACKGDSKNKPHVTKEQLDSELDEMIAQRDHYYLSRNPAEVQT